MLRDQGRNRVRARASAAVAARILATGAIGVIGVIGILGLAGCRPDEPPVRFSVTVPAADTLQFQAELIRRYGLGIGGSFDILQYGSIQLEPETPDHGFRFGFTLNTGVFVPQTWVGYREVEYLPTGAPFPSWQTGPVVDLVIPPINTPAVDWHFYFGTRGQFYLGVAAVVRAINQNFPALNIGYTFYDSQGRVVLGLLFFGPWVDANGQLRSPGGIWVGTNLTPFLPSPGGSRSAAGELVASEALGLVARAGAGEPLSFRGQSVVSEVRVGGQDARRYRSERKLRRAVRSFIEAIR